MSHPQAPTNNNKRRKRPQYSPVQSYRINPHHFSPSQSLNARTIAVARAALKWVTGASIGTSALLMLQLVWIALKTPRLPPPPLSGVDFLREGRVVTATTADHDEGDGGGDGCDHESNASNLDDNATSKANESKSKNTSDQNKNTHQKKRKEFRLVLVGDSPVEGIGNAHHNHALGGQTARAFAKLVCQKEDGYDYEHVRYWSYGKSGLTARGIEKEMVPLLHRVVDDVRDSDAVSSDEPAIHAIILLCGVNNVLDNPMKSTTSSFYSEVQSILKSIRCHPGLECTPLIVLGLPDFAKLPFLPWPLTFALGLRGRKMQRMLELAVRELQLKERDNNFDENESQGGKINTAIVGIPEIQDVLGIIGYHRHDSDSDVGNTGGTNDAHKSNGNTGLLKMRLCHPLLKYLGDSANLDQTKLCSLGIEDFLCDDGFHPGGYGTVYIGNLIAENYVRMTGNFSDRSKSS